MSPVRLRVRKSLAVANSSPMKPRRRSQAKLDVALKLPCVDAAPALGGRLIELEEPELDFIQDLD